VYITHIYSHHTPKSFKFWSKFIGIVLLTIILIVSLIFLLFENHHQSTEQITEQNNVSQNVKIYEYIMLTPPGIICFICLIVIAFAYITNENNILNPY